MIMTLGSPSHSPVLLLLWVLVILVSMEMSFSNPSVLVFDFPSELVPHPTSTGGFLSHLLGLIITDTQSSAHSI